MCSKICDDEFSESTKEFLIESRENLDQMERDLVALESAPQSRELLDNIFRAVHTLKGSCGFLSFAKLESIAHAGENLLDDMRSGKLLLNREVASALLMLADYSRRILVQIERDGSEGTDDCEGVISTLRALQGRATPTPIIAADNKATDLEENHSSTVSDTTIRVDVALLDKLMNLVGELVLARNQVLQFTSSRQGTGLLGTSQRLNLVTSELQEGVMKTRMQPIGNIWRKFPRIVRDLAVVCGKQVRLEMEGQATETDKSIIEAIKDPLTHLLRNAIDHGIETPQTRLAHGKPAEGRMVLRAFHEGGQVIIEMSDDGRGINVEQIKKSAQERGLINAEQAARLSEREALKLIFLPGLSTAAEVTSISGRGVGMDVVRANLDKIGGTVDVQSQLGRGTTFKIKIPLTLAIIPALIIANRGERYAIPQVSLLELVRFEASEVHKKVEMIHDAPVYRLRGKLLPLVYLSNVFKLPAPRVPAPDFNIIVLKADEREFGLVVDEVHDTEEIVVKPLSKQLKGVSAFAGATIMGDGRVALILDVFNIAQAANVVSSAQERSTLNHEREAAAKEKAKEDFLLFEVRQKGRMAIPLSMVTRLEEFPTSSIEKSGRLEVIQYRGRIMPLIPVKEMIYAEERATAANSGSEFIHVIVHSNTQQSVGLIVGRILDIVSETMVLQRPSKDFGILGSTVLQGHVTDLLDIRGIITSVDDSFFETSLPTGTHD